MGFLIVSFAGLLVLAVVILVVVFVGAEYLARKKPRRSAPSYQGCYTHGEIDWKKVAKKRKREQTSRQLDQQESRIKDREKYQLLVSRLRGDRDTALRLVKSAKINNPGRDETWYWEKVLRDLDRDRR